MQLCRLTRTIKNHVAFSQRYYTLANWPFNELKHFIEEINCLNNLKLTMNCRPLKLKMLTQSDGWPVFSFSPASATRHLQAGPHTAKWASDHRLISTLIDHRLIMDLPVETCRTTEGFRQQLLSVFVVLSTVLTRPRHVKDSHPALSISHVVHRKRTQTVFIDFYIYFVHNSFFIDSNLTFKNLDVLNPLFIFYYCNTKRSTKTTTTTTKITGLMVLPALLPPILLDIKL